MQCILSVNIWNHNEKKTKPPQLAVTLVSVAF